MPASRPGPFSRTKTKSTSTNTGRNKSILNWETNNIDDHIDTMREIFKEVVPSVGRSRVEEERPVPLHTSTPLHSPARPRTTSQQPSRNDETKCENGLGDQEDVKPKIKTEVIDKGYEKVLKGKKGLNDVGYDKSNDVEILAFACPLCHRQFRRLHALRTHVEAIHPEPGSKSKYSCKLCNRAFANQGGLKNHKNYCQSKKTATERPNREASKEIRQFEKISSLNKKKKKPSNHTMKTSSNSNLEGEHKGEFNYVCNTCNNIFKGEIKFEIHKRETGHKEATRFKPPVHLDI